MAIRNRRSGAKAGKKSDPDREFKAQDAMEYLMTYGWAILIIAVIIGVLFQLNAFNGKALSPKSQAGACQVVRPFGPGTTTLASLAGQCTGNFPQYIAAFGNGSRYQAIVNQTFFQGNSFTVLGWMYWPYTTTGTNYDKDIGYAWSGANTVPDMGFGIFVRSNPNYNPPSTPAPAACKVNGGTPCWYMNFYTDDIECGYGPSPGHWYQFGGSWDNKTKLQTIWVDGAPNCTRTSTGTLMTDGPLIIGSGSGTWNVGAYMFGLLTNIQIYNKSLSQQEVQTLYLEGIDGAPIDIGNLQGWWQLNGNVDDYSGNGNNGYLYNSSYSGLWSTSYTPP